MRITPRSTVNVKKIVVVDLGFHDWNNLISPPVKPIVLLLQAYNNVYMQYPAMAATQQFAPIGYPPGEWNIFVNNGSTFKINHSFTNRFINEMIRNVFSKFDIYRKFVRLHAIVQQDLSPTLIVFETRSLQA